MDEMSGGAGDLGPTRADRFRDVIETMNRAHEQPDGTGTVKCARCLGTVHYEKLTRKVSGRLWSRGKCETEGCVSWIS